MTPRALWTVPGDYVVPVKLGPGAWHRCGHCRTRYRALGRWVRVQTPPCPTCATRRRARRLTPTLGAHDA